MHEYILFYLGYLLLAIALDEESKELKDLADLQSKL